MSKTKAEPQPVALDKRKIHLNSKLLIVLVAALLVIGIGSYFLHAYNVKRTSTALYDRAQKAHEEGNIDEAVKFLQRYVELQPGKPEDLLQLGEWIDDSATSGRSMLRAYQMLDRSLSLKEFSDREDLRRRVVRLAFKLGRFRDAIDRLDEVCQKSGGAKDALCNRDLEMLAIRARSFEELNDFDRAVDEYVRGIHVAESEEVAVDPKFSNVEFYVRLIALIDRRGDKIPARLRQLEREFGPEGAAPRDESAEPPTAEAITNLLLDTIERRSKPPLQGLMARTIYYRDHNKLNEAAGEIKKALELDGTNSDVLIQAIEVEMAQATAARMTGDKDKKYASHIRAANELVVRAREAAPDDLRLYISLWRVTTDSNRFEEAEEHIREGLRRLAEILEKDPKKRKTVEQTELENRLNWALANTLIAEAFPASGQIQEKKLAEASETIDHLQSLGVRAPILNYLRARILMGRREWRPAAEMLASLRGELSEFPDAVRNADLALATCYERLGLPDDRLSALQRAVEADPYWIPTQVAYANALSALSRDSEALAVYGRLQQVPSIPMQTARILLRKQLLLPEAQRRWEGIEALVRLVDQLQPGTAESRLLRGELLYHQRKFDAASEEFETAVVRDPDMSVLWAGLVGVQLRRSDLSTAERISRAEEALKRADEALPKHVDIALLHADIALVKGPAALTPVLKSLEERASEFSVTERVALFRGLAAAWDRNGDSSKTAELLQKAADLALDDLNLQLGLAEWAVRENDETILSEAFKRVRQIEGPHGANGDFLEAESILVEQQKLKASQRDAARLADARQLLENAGRIRRSWAAVPRALGILEVLRGNQVESVIQFRRALEMGDRSRDTLMSVFSALYQEKRFNEILSETRRISQETPQVIAGDVGRIVTLAAYEGKQLRDALEYSKNLGEKSGDYRDKVLLAQMLSTDPKEYESAKKHFREAIDLAPNVPQVWAFLVGFLVQNKHSDEAQAVIDDADKRVPNDPAYLRPQILSALYELIGNRKEAEKYLLEAQAKAPANLGLVNDAMIFYLRGKEIEKADAEIEKIVKSGNADKPMLDSALRTRALITANRGGSYDDVQKAIHMIESNAEKGSEQPSVADLKAKAMLLTRTQFRRDRLRLIECLEEIDKQGQLTNGDRFQLAQLYDQMNKPAEAQALYSRLLDVEPGNVPVLAAMALSKLKGKDISEETLEEVGRIVGQLERKEPRSLRTVVLKAQWLEAQGKSADAVPLFRQFLSDMKSYRPEELFRDLIKQQKTGEALALLSQIAGRKDDGAIKVIVEQARKLLNGGEETEALGILQRYVTATEVVETLQSEIINQIAGILETIGQPAAAEETYRQYVSRMKAIRPDATLVLAAFLARHKRIEEALEQCREASAGTPTARMVSVSVGVLRAGKPTPEQIVGVEKQILGALESATGAEAIALSLSLADLRDIQGRYDETITIYRSILEKDSNNVIALNNLSWMLSFMPTDRSACLPLVNRAIHLRGPVADLLDTRAVIHLNLNKPRDAIKDLKSAYDEVGSPSILFHLAQAQLRAGDADAARETYRQAELAGFDPKTVHPLERPGLDELTKGLVDSRRVAK